MRSPDEILAQIHVLIAELQQVAPTPERVALPDDPTVGALISALARMPQGAPVRVNDDYGSADSVSRVFSWHNEVHII